ncbi:MAG: hypothetical protein K0M47_09280, partial [Rhizobium sp.]|nr:hypothetical protein [Rhizobium sp.]
MRKRPLIRPDRATITPPGWRGRPRDPEEHHRAATPHALLLDQVSVIAIASAAVGVHHGHSAGPALEATITIGMAIFAAS